MDASVEKLSRGFDCGKFVTLNVTELPMVVSLRLASVVVYDFCMDLSEFDGLEPVSKHELDTLLAHLPNGALGRFELRLILRVRELEKALEPKFDGTCEPSSLYFGDYDLDVQPMTVEEWNRAVNVQLKREFDDGYTKAQQDLDAAYDEGYRRGYYDGEPDM